MLPCVNIHTHRPTGCGIELRTAGVHPWEAGNNAAEAIGRLAERLCGRGPGPCETLRSEAVQAIGETGLDFACAVPREAQFNALRAQLALARQAGMPVVLHCVRAFEPLMRELAECEPRAVIFHGFIGSPEQARQALRRGYYLSFGERAFASPKTLRALREVPLGQLFFETDDDEVTIGEIYARAAAVLGLPEEVLQRATLENYERLFEKRDG